MTTSHQPPRLPPLSALQRSEACDTGKRWVLHTGTFLIASRQNPLLNSLVEGTIIRNKLSSMSKTRFDHSRLQLASRPGFTMTELMVVISILTILFLLSSVGINRFRESAKQAKCLGNLRQIGIAVLGYASDRGGLLPHTVTGEVDKPTSHSSIWQQDLDPYVPYPKTNPAGAGGGACEPNGNTVWFCPSAQKERGWWGTEPDYAAVGRGSAVAGTSGVFSQNAWGTHIPALRVSLIQNPARCLMVVDACSQQSVKDGTWSARLNLSNLSVSSALPGSSIAPRHGFDGRDSRSGRFGALFCDGHVEAFSYGDPRLRDRTFVQSLLVPF